MLRSLYAGVTGMRSNQTKMDVIGNNISNSSTTAFKSGRARFQDMLSQTLSNAQSPSAQGKGGINAQQVGLGVSVAAIDTMFGAGALQPTGRALDFAIENDGFFIVSDDASGTMKRYTRDGAFFKDFQGNLVNAEGLRILGYKPSGGANYTKDINQINNAVMANLQPISISSELTVPDQYKDGGFSLTNPASGIISNITVGNYTGDNGEIKIKLGEDFDLDTVNGEYKGTVEVTYIDGSKEIIDVTGLDATNPMINAKGLEITLEANLDNTNKNQTFTTEITGMEPATYKQVSLEAYSIDGSGLISAVYNDGQVYYLGRLGMAKFQNPEGLEKLGGNSYANSRNSGEPEIGNPNEDGFGVVRQGNLEMSNVDLANEFTEMIVTSRSYQANSRTITTSDEMLQELINLKR